MKHQESKPHAHRYQHRAPCPVRPTSVSSPTAYTNSRTSKRAVTCAAGELRLARSRGLFLLLLFQIEEIISRAAGIGCQERHEAISCEMAWERYLIHVYPEFSRAGRPAVCIWRCGCSSSAGRFPTQSSSRALSYTKRQAIHFISI